MALATRLEISIKTCSGSPRTRSAGTRTSRQTLRLSALSLSSLTTCATLRCRSRETGTDPFLPRDLRSPRIRMSWMRSRSVWARWSIRSMMSLTGPEISAQCWSFRIWMLLSIPAKGAFRSWVVSNTWRVFSSSALRSRLLAALNCWSRRRSTSDRDEIRYHSTYQRTTADRANMNPTGSPCPNTVGALGRMPGETHTPALSKPTVIR